MAKFYTVPTAVGEAKIANAIALGRTLTIAELAIGDGNGSLPNPDSDRTSLVNQVRRAPINTSVVDDDNPNWIVVEQVIPPDEGGWTIREIGLFDSDGDMIAYGNYPETYKPILSEGSGRTQTIRFVMQVSDTAAVTLKVDPSIVLATRKLVDDKLAQHAESRDHPDATTTQRGFVKKATRDATRQRSSTASVVTPDGLDGAMADHENATTAHNASQIALDKSLDVFGDTDTVQAVLALLGAAAKASNHNDIDGRDSSDAHPMGAITGLSAALEALDKAIGSKPDRDQVVRADKASQIDVGRGVVKIENHDQDNADGAGLTFRTTDNPSDGSPESVGAILAIRSSGDALRLWVGQSVTSTGDNDFETRNLKASGIISGNGSGLNGVNADTVDGWHRDRLRKWGNITGKPATATRWPRWSEVSGKPNLTQNTGAGQVGTYALMADIAGITSDAGATTAGSNLRFCNANDGNKSGKVPAGTWRCMGYSPGGGSDTGRRATVWLRVA